MEVAAAIPMVITTRVTVRPRQNPHDTACKNSACTEQAATRQGTGGEALRQSCFNGRRRFVSECLRGQSRFEHKHLKLIKLNVSTLDAK
jgi:hypothetical protein